MLSKTLIDIPVRYLHNDMIKLSDNVGLDSVFDSVTHKFLIDDTLLKVVYTTTSS